MFVNYVHTTKITQYGRCLCVTRYFAHAVHEPATMTGVAPCHKNLDTHILQGHYYIWSIHYVTIQYFM